MKQVVLFALRENVFENILDLLLFEKFNFHLNFHIFDQK